VDTLSSEMLQGAAKDGIGAVVERLERQYVAIPPHEHCRCTGEVVGQLRRQPAAGGTVVPERGWCRHPPWRLCGGPG
jgi:hypothetical protein